MATKAVGRPEKAEQTNRMLGLLDDGISITKLARILKKSPSVISRKVRNLKDKNLIQKSTYGYTLTGLGKLRLLRSENPRIAKTSLPMKNTTGNLSFRSRFHDLKLKIPMLVKGSPLERKVKINNWVKEYQNIDLPMPITIEATTKSIILHFYEHEFERDNDFMVQSWMWMWKGAHGAEYYLSQFGYKLDMINAEVINQHIATQQEKPIDTRVPKHTQITVGLERNQATFTGKTKKEATAWLEKSKGIAEVESDDLTYQEKLILMPEKVHDIKKELASLENSIPRLNKVNAKLARTNINLAVNMETHVSIMQKIDKGLGAFTDEIARLNILLDKVTVKQKRIRNIKR